MPKLNHTSYTYKQIVELLITSISIITMFGASFMSIEPQNDPTLHEHASQSFHAILGETQPTIVHLPTPKEKITFSFELFGLGHNMIPFFGC
jgi:hypothetical protein